MAKESFLKAINIFSITNRFWFNRRLILQFAYQDFATKFKGSFLGIFWAIFVPLLMLSVYTFVFSSVFKSRWPGQSLHEDSHFYALMLFAGLIPFNLFAETIGSTPRIIRNHSNLVKRAVFPLEILPVSRVFSVIFQALINLAILLIGTCLITEPQWSMLLFPLVIIPTALFCLGLAYFTAAVGVFVQDLGHFVGILITFVMFLSPVFYPLQAVPDHIKPYLYLNPLAIMIECFRDVLVLGLVPDPETMLTIWALGLITMCIGFGFFVRTKHAFADVV